MCGLGSRNGFIVCAWEGGNKKKATVEVPEFLHKVLGKVLILKISILKILSLFPISEKSMYPLVHPSLLRNLVLLQPPPIYNSNLPSIIGSNALTWGYRRSPHFVIFGTKRVSQNAGITNCGDQMSSAVRGQLFFWIIVKNSVLPGKKR